MPKSRTLPALPDVARRLRRAADDAGPQGGTRTQWIRELAREYAASAEDLKPLVDGALAQLEESGTLVTRRKRWFALSHSGLRRGVVRRTGRRAFRVRDLDSGDRFEVEPRNLTPAHHRDSVLFEVIRADRSRDRRNARRRGGTEKSARVVRVVERASRRWVGILHRSRYGIEFAPFDGRDRHEARDLDLEQVLAARELKGADFARGIWVEIQLMRKRPQKRRGNRRSTRRDDSQRSGPSARLVRVLGSPDDANIETLVTIAAFEIPDEFPEALEDAGTGGADDSAGPGTRDDRRDLRKLTTFTIDGASARDFDDAISIETRGRGVRLWVHIADVSRYVRPGSAVDDEARHRGTSVYFADRAVHMLPSSLSEGECSLVPRKDRFALSVSMDFDAKGRRQGTKVFATKIRSDQRLTYDQVARFLDGGEDAGCAAVGDELRRAQRLTKHLLAQRAARGTFEIEQSQRSFVLDPDGRVARISRTPRNFAHRMIEEFMIQANVAVAELVESRLENGDLDTRAVPMFRRHEPPSEAERKDLQQALQGLGIERPELTFDEVGDYASLLESLEDPRIRGLVEGLVLRSLQRAHYVAEPAAHFALGLDSYSHFTSPIRRYPDLVMHRFIKSVVLGRTVHLPTLGRDADGASAASTLSELEQRAEQAEREQARWRTVKWLEGRLGERFDAVVTGLEPFGIFVQLDDLGVDGLVPFDDDLESISGPPRGDRRATDQVRVRPRRGGTRVLRRGDAVAVEITHCDLIERRITLALLPDRDGERADARKSGRRGEVKRPQTKRAGRGKSSSGEGRGSRRRSSRKRGRGA